MSVSSMTAPSWKSASVPRVLSGQEWFTKLTNAYAMDFMALSGGRGAFKLTPEELAVAKSAALQ